MGYHLVMKISELIEKLQTSQREHGDIEVIIYDEYSGEDDHYKNITQLDLHRERDVWSEEGDSLDPSPGFIVVPEKRLELL